MTAATVKATYERELAGKTKDSQPMVHPSKLDGFREIITEKYTAGCSAMSIFKFIQKRGFTNVREFCRSFKQAETHKATIRVRTHTRTSTSLRKLSDTLVVFHVRFGLIIWRLLLIEMAVALVQWIA